MLNKVVFINSFVLVFFAAMIGMLLGPSYFNLLPIDLVYSELCQEHSEVCNQNPDSINIAVQLGRLDFISIALAMLAIAIGFVGIFGFMSIKEQARIDAKRVAEETAELMVTAYLEKHYPDILARLWEKVEPEIVARGDFNELMGSDNNNNNDFNDIASSNSEDEIQ